MLALGEHATRTRCHPNIINEIENLPARTGIPPKQLTHEMLRSLRNLENEAAVRSVRIKMV